MTTPLAADFERLTHATIAYRAAGSALTGAGIVVPPAGFELADVDILRVRCMVSDPI
jgi:hypothetical protein